VSRDEKTLFALDTAVWIHWIEQDERFLPAVAPWFAALREERATAVTSVLALLETLTGAFRRGDDLLARRYEEILGRLSGVTVLPVTRSVARRAAQLRTFHGLATPDAIHVATAIEARAEKFVTTDRRLARVKEIPVRVLKPGAPTRPRR
jgi:predicted nucleic acid-binding protein